MSRARISQMRASLRTFKHGRSFLPGHRKFLNHSEGATRFSPKHTYKGPYKTRPRVTFYPLQGLDYNAMHEYPNCVT